MITKALIFDARSCSLVEGRLLPFTERTQEATGDYKDVQLFNYKRKWYLHYAYNRCTGYFKSRKKAAEWFNKSGR
jgi:hypothetical protein